MQSVFLFEDDLGYSTDFNKNDMEDTVLEARGSDMLCVKHNARNIHSSFELTHCLGITKIFWKHSLRW